MAKSTSKTKLTVKDAFRLAAADKVFAEALGKNPQAFAEVFNLKPEEVDEIAKARSKAPGKRDWNYE